MKQQFKFFDQTQPQTLQIAVLLFYFTAAFDIFFMLLGQFDPVRIVLVLVGALCAYGIANEKRIGYLGAIGLAVLNLAWFLFASYFFGIPILSFNGILALMFDVALLVLLVHPMSRDYQKIWFR